MLVFISIWVEEWDRIISYLRHAGLVSLILNPNTEISGDLNSDDLTNIQDIIILLNIILS